MEGATRGQESGARTVKAGLRGHEDSSSLVSNHRGLLEVTGLVYAAKFQAHVSSFN